jgi:hypothetical protein
VFGLNNRGQIAGYVAADELLNDAHGFVLAKGVGGPLTSVDVPHAPRTIVLGINNQGQIVGQYENPDATSPTRRVGVQRMGLAPGLLGAGLIAPAPRAWGERWPRLAAARVGRRQAATG